VAFYVNQPSYVDPDYAPKNFVGTPADAYHVAGFVTNLVEMDPLELISGDDPTWENALYWVEPRTDIWGPLLIADADKIVNASIAVTANATVTPTARKLHPGDTSILGEFSVTADADINLAGASLLANSGTLDVTATRTRSITQELASEFTLESTAISVLQASATLEGFAATLLVGNRIQPGAIEIDTTATLSIEPSVTRNLEADLEANFNLTGLGLLGGIGNADLNAEFTLDTDPLKIKGIFRQSFGAEASVIVNAGPIFAGSATFNAFNSLVSAITTFNPDPLRIYIVDSETRIHPIDAESRVFAVKSENRVNTVEQETRGFIVKSETRKTVI